MFSTQTHPLSIYCPVCFILHIHSFIFSPFVLFEPFENKLHILWHFTPTYFSMYFVRIKIFFSITTVHLAISVNLTLTQYFYIIYGSWGFNQCWSNISHLSSDSLRTSIVLHFVVNKVKLLITLGRYALNTAQTQQK